MTLKKYKRFNIRYLLSIILLIIVFCSGCTNNKLSFPANNAGKTIPLKYATKKEIYNADMKIRAVSLTAFKDGFIGTSYVSLFYYDEKMKKRTEIKCPEGYAIGYELQSDKRKKIWNPTGCFYNKKEDLLYLANYNGHNVLVCKISDDLTCTVLKEISTESMVSPENIYINKNGMIAVADYDGNSLFMFDNDGQLMWSRNIGLAHGVTMSDNNVYVTSLLDRSISSFDYNGNLIKTIGELGFEGQDKFMWPTALDYYNKQLLITDAHTGRIYLYDEDLNYISSIGGNGASNNTFNFPYTANVMNHSIYVADCYNERIVILNLNGEVINIIGKPIDMENDLVIHPYKNVPYTYGEIEDIDSSIFNPYLDAKVVSAYGGLMFATDDYYFQLNVSDYLCNQNVFNKSTPYIEQPYITWVKKVIYDEKTYYVISDSQISWFFFIYNETDNIFFLSAVDVDSDGEKHDGFTVDFDDIWFVEGQWYSGTDIDQMLMAVISQGHPYTEIYLELVASGMDRKTAYIIAFLDYYNYIFGSSMTNDDFNNWLESNFSSNAGKEFLNNYSIDNEKLLQQTENFFKKTIAGNTHLCETFFVHTFGATISY